MFERRRKDIGCLQEVRIRVYEGEEVQVLEERISGGQKWSRDHGERRPSTGG